MKHKIAVGVLWLFILCAAPQVRGQSGLFLGVQGGYSIQKPSLKEVKFNADTSFLYGARIGFKFLMLGAELNVFRASHDLDARDLLALHWGEEEIRYSYLGVNLKYFFPLLLLHPYVSVGYGYYTADIQNVEKDTQEGFNLGFGAELHLGSKISILAEGRYHRATLDIDNQELKLGDFTLNGGINVYF